MLDDVLNSVVKDLDSSSNAEPCIIKFLYDLFVKQGQQKIAVGIDALRVFEDGKDAKYMKGPQ